MRKKIMEKTAEGMKCCGAIVKSRDSLDGVTWVCPQCGGQAVKINDSVRIGNLILQRDDIVGFSQKKNWKKNQNSP